jgi:hypothetical protein
VPSSKEIVVSSRAQIASSAVRKLSSETQTSRSASPIVTGGSPIPWKVKLRTRVDIQRAACVAAK